MMKWISNSIPLPLGAIENRRSFVGLDNLVDLIVACIKHVNAANQIFLVSDDEDLSTPELCMRLGIALHKPARLFSVPASWLYFFAAVLRRQKIADRLCSSLQVDISKTKRLLGWSPKVGIRESLAAAAYSFINKNSHESR
jgi:nucleoside-diphosphate-sugar epimerase